MAASVKGQERRAGPRVGPAQRGWPHEVLVRPGGQAHVLDVGLGGALFEVGFRLVPGTDVRVTVPGQGVLCARVVRSEVYGITRAGRLLYRVAAKFEESTINRRVAASQGG